MNVTKHPISWKTILAGVIWACWVGSSLHAQILVDDFSDGIDDGWTHSLTGEGDPWGPGIFDPSSGAYNLFTLGQVPPGLAGTLSSFWDESADPYYNHGIWRASVRTELGGTNVAFTLRDNSTPGSPGYFVTTGVVGNLALWDGCGTGCISRLVEAENIGFSPGEDWILEAGAVGDLITAKLWQDGETVPDEPQIIFRNDKYPTGQFGVVSFIGTTWTEPAQVNAFFDDIYFTPSLACDLNGDRACDGTDIDLLMNEIAAKTNTAKFDLSGDQTVNNSDRDAWLEQASVENGFAESLLVGDTNLDGTVNAIDLNALALNWRQDVDDWTRGNFTDAGVDAADLNALALNWQQSTPVASAVNTPVPEPSAWLLTLVGLALIWQRRGLC